LGKTIPLPGTEKELHALLLSQIRDLVGAELEPGVYLCVERYAHRGMSSGRVSFWLSQVIPGLLARFRNLQR